MTLDDVFQKVPRDVLSEAKSKTMKILVVLALLFLSAVHAKLQLLFPEFEGMQLEVSLGEINASNGIV